MINDILAYFEFRNGLEDQILGFLFAVGNSSSTGITTILILNTKQERTGIEWIPIFIHYSPAYVCKSNDEIVDERIHNSYYEHALNLTVTCCQGVNYLVPGTWYLVLPVVLIE